MCTVLRLQIRMRVPVGIKPYDRIGCLQVATETTGTGGEDEDFVRGILRVEEVYVDVGGTFFGLDASIKTEVLSVVLKECFHDVHHLGHLEGDEYEDLRTYSTSVSNPDKSRYRTYSVARGKKLG